MPRWSADSTPGGRILSLGAHGGVLCGGVRPPASGSPLWKPALVLAAGIAFSRLYLYVHWPTDVLGAFWWRRRRLGRRAAGRRPPPQAGAAGPQGIAEKRTGRLAVRSVRLHAAFSLA
ncbi:MAG: phosphatase PAP2 family protein [Dysosmobacter welbionis]